MDHSVSSLSYQGSIVEAIAEAKRQKKLLVVYISDDNAKSAQLEGSTWMDSNVAESISKFCILLHIEEGGADAANFSAIYPQKSAPCITAVGYNGVQLWQNEGFISADILVSSLQKAWLSLHIQETILTAALVSKNSEPQDADNSSSASFERGSSSCMNIPSPSVDKPTECLEASALDSLEMENNRRPEHSDEDHEEMKINLGNTSPGSVSANILDRCEDELTTSLFERSKESLSRVKLGGNNTGLGGKETEDNWDNAIEDDKFNSGVKTETSQVSVDKETEGIWDKKANVVQDEKINNSETLSKSTDVHLNIRLRNGATLQKKFLLTNTLRMVKYYVDENQASASGSYDLAIPYPRKVFNDQDLNKTLSELGLFGRQALIVVPLNQATGYHRGESSSHVQKSSPNNFDSPNSSNEGYFSYLKRILSYVNPLSYLSGGASSSNSSPESQGNMRQDGPNPALQNNLRGRGRPYTASSSNQSTEATGRNDSSRQVTSSRFGSNIHTLKHDEDDSRFSDKNAYWNGNSTQYGGDNDSK